MYKVLVLGSLAPKPFFVRVLAQTFNRFPTEEQYLSWFRAAGATDVQYKHVSNPWNTQQYAIAIIGTRSAASALPVPRKEPPAPSTFRTLRRLAYWPIVLARFGLAVAAFCVVGPLQVANAAAGMRRLRMAGGAVTSSA